MIIGLIVAVVVLVAIVFEIRRQIGPESPEIIEARSKNMRGIKDATE